MKQATLSFDEKRAKLHEYWQAQALASAKRNGITPELLRLIQDTQNPSVEDDILLILLELYRDSLVNPLTPACISQELLKSISNNKQFSNSKSTQSRHCDLMLSLLVAISKADARNLIILSQFIAKNITSLEYLNDSFYQELKPYNEHCYSFAGKQFQTYEQLEQYVDCSLVQELRAELESCPESQYITVSVRSKG